MPLRSSADRCSSTASLLCSCCSACSWWHEALVLPHCVAAPAATTSSRRLQDRHPRVAARGTAVVPLAAPKTADAHNTPSTQCFWRFSQQAALT
jgi:hypothetical protein